MSAAAFAHVFERIGLGVAPYVCVGLRKEPTCCAFCGTPIVNCYVIKSANGREFVVGSDCVARTGDAGLLKSLKNSPEVRAARRAMAKAKDELVSAELTALLDEPPAALQSASLEWQNSEGSLLRHIKTNLPYCGMAGRARYLRLVHTAITNAAP